MGTSIIWEGSGAFPAVMTYEVHIPACLCIQIMKEWKVKLRE